MTRGRKPKADAIRRGLKDAYDLQVSSGDAVGIRMPDTIAADEELAAIWAWIAPPTNSFTEQDMPNLVLLVNWHKIAAKAIEENDIPNLKRASSEIRAYSDMLGLSPLARSRIGLMDATIVKTAADTAKMFSTIDDAYGELPDIIEIEALDVSD